MGRVLFVLDLKLTRFLRVVIVPGLSCYALAALLAWPAAFLVASLNRWQGAGVLAGSGHCVRGRPDSGLASVDIDGRREAEGVQDGHRGLEAFRGREAAA